MSLVITKDEIGDPFAAMRRVQEFRKNLYRPKAKYAPQTPPKVEKELERAEAVREAEANPRRAIIREKFDAETGAFYKVMIEDGLEVRVTPGLAILIEVAQEYGLMVADLKGPSRVAYAVEARRKAFYRLRTETTLSYPQMGRLLGNRDHSTAIHNYHKFKELRYTGAHDFHLRKGRD